jgi:hypothetical protein
MKKAKEFVAERWSFYQQMAAVKPEGEAEK